MRMEMVRPGERSGRGGGGGRREEEGEREVG